MSTLQVCFLLFALGAIYSLATINLPSFMICALLAIILGVIQFIIHIKK